MITTEEQVFLNMWKERGDKVIGMKNKVIGWNRGNQLKIIWEKSIPKMKLGLNKMKKHKEDILKSNNYLEKKKLSIVTFLILFTTIAIEKKRKLQIYI